MNRRNFIKRGALFLPTIFVPRLIRAQSDFYSPQFVAGLQGQSVVSGGGGSGPTPLIQWITTAGIATSSGKVTSWTDQISGIVLVGENGGPDFTSSVQNGLPGISFGGSASLAKSSLGVSLSSGTVFVACRTPAFGGGGGGSYAILFDSYTSSNRWFADRRSDGKWEFGAGSTSLTGTTLPTNSSNHIIGGKINGASSETWVDAIKEKSGATGTATLSSLRVGALNSGTLQWSGYIFEIRFYNSVLSDTDMATVFAELNSTWAIY